jgi:hypothetical protein
VNYEGRGSFVKGLEGGALLLIIGGAHIWESIPPSKFRADNVKKNNFGEIKEAPGNIYGGICLK